MKESLCVVKQQQQQQNHWSRLICSFAIDLGNNSNGRITISSKTLFFRIPIYLLHLKFICIELLNPFGFDGWFKCIMLSVCVRVYCAPPYRLVAHPSIEIIPVRYERPSVDVMRHRSNGSSTCLTRPVSHLPLDRHVLYV